MIEIDRKEVATKKNIDYVMDAQQRYAQRSDNRKSQNDVKVIQSNNCVCL